MQKNDKYYHDVERALKNNKPSRKKLPTFSIRNLKHGLLIIKNTQYD